MTHRQESSDSVRFPLVSDRIAGRAAQSPFEVSSSFQFTNNPEYWAQSRSPRHNFRSAVWFTDLGWKSREVERPCDLSVPELDSKKEA
jgi:hypothetical protein